MKTVDALLEETGWSLSQLAQRSGLAVARLEAIASGRWTPSPHERQVIAAALDCPVDEISWGHTLNPRNLRYHRFGLQEPF